LWVFCNWFSSSSETVPTPFEVSKRERILYFDSHQVRLISYLV
jgi:hypothetical protein